MNQSKWPQTLVPVGIVLALAGDARAADPSPESAQACIQASEQGQSRRDEGKYRAARERFLSCARDACPAIILKSCAAWLRELDEIAPTVVLAAQDDQGADVADVTVSFDGARLTSRLDGRPIEVDAGEHLLRFEREGSVPVEQRFVLRAGERARVIRVTMRSTTPVEAAPVPVPPPDTTIPPEPVLSPRHVTIAALLVGAAGAAGTGLYFTLHAQKNEQSAEGLRSGLPTNACTGVSTSSCQSLGDTVRAQHTDLNVATGLFVGAGALVAGSIATWLLWPKPSSAPATSGWVAPVPGGALFSIVGSLP